jgi:hypothetical protein
MVAAPAPGASSAVGDNAGAASDFGATARVREEPRGTTRRTIEKDDLSDTPGTRGDPLRVVELLPGVARPPLDSGVVIIRGSAPYDSEVFFEGAQVIRLYHFGGLTSFTNARLLDHIDLYPGNFSVRYGRKIGGIIDVGTRDPRSDGFHAVVDSNVIDSSILAEGPVGAHASVGVALRRSTIDLFADQLAPPGSILSAPVYDDYQLFLSYHPTQQDRLRVLVYGSRDRLAILMKNPGDTDPAIYGPMSQESYFHRAQLSWDHRFSDNASQSTQVTLGTVGFIASAGQAANENITGPELFGRSEWRLRLGRALALDAGVDVSMQWLHGSYDGPVTTPDEGDPASNGPVTTMPAGRADGDFGIFRPAAYVEAELRPADPLTIVAGGRADYFGDIRQTTFDPRATARLRVGDTTTLKGGAGLFSQPPNYGQAVAGIGNPNLRAARALHFDLGVDRDAGSWGTFGLEGFFKLDRDLVDEAPDGSGLVNGGRGRIYGVEASARVAAGRRASGFVSYTLSRSLRSDNGGPWRLFDYDQTHILTVAANVHLRHGWELGGVFRLVSGDPMTPVNGSVYNANVDLYSPAYGAVNSARNPLYHRLDLRVEKQWHPGRFLLATYLDLQNAYNQKNRETVTYNFDFTQTANVYGLPVIPSIGLRGEL